MLDELDELRRGHVTQRHLDDCARTMRRLDGSAKAAAHGIRQIAETEFAALPALHALLRRWAVRVKSDADVPLLVAHFERLALVSALTSALHRAAERLPRSLR